MDETEYDDQDAIPPDILRVMQDINQSWRGCRRKSCRRSRSCRGADVICMVARPPRDVRDGEKGRRDDARAMAIFQRMLRERLEQVRSKQEQAEAEKAARPRRQRY